MKIWAIGDLHLSFGVKNKSMDLFGPAWQSHADRIERHWRRLIHPDDLVLIPGDISWAMKLDDAVPDLRWIDALPGTKLLLKGNHDYWWGSLKQIAQVLPPSLHLIQNNSFSRNGVSIGGARLWDTEEYRFGNYIEWQENPAQNTRKQEEEAQEDLQEKIFQRELQRLELSLASLPKEAELRIAMTHYPPIGADLAPSAASRILEKHRVSLCVFGHLHNVRKDALPFGTLNGVRYVLASADYIGFEPVCVFKE